MLGVGASVFFLALAFYLTQVNGLFTDFSEVNNLSAQAIQAQQPGITVAGSVVDTEQGQGQGIRNNVSNMVIDDIKLGSGDEVKSGDTVAVHYVGTLQSGQEFDNSRKRGEPLEFVVGTGMVIEGWDKGLVGMRVGGQRTLVIPPEMGYGERGIGPIPGNATLFFAIELVDIK